MIYLFPGDFIFWSSVKNHESIKQSLLSMISNNLSATSDNQRYKWLCDVNTEFFNQNVFKYLPLITNQIYPSLDKMFLELQNLSNNFKVPKVSTVTQIWYNHYEANGNQEVHSHAGSSFSGIYILNLNEENKTVFCSYNASMFIAGTEVKQLKEAKEGDIIIFPSNLLHYVLPCEQTRDSIAFNISCEY